MTLTGKDIHLLLNTADYAFPVIYGENWLAQVDQLIAGGYLTVEFDYRTGHGARAARTIRYQKRDAVSVRVSESGVEKAIDWLVSNGHEDRAKRLAVKTDPHRSERAQAAAKVVSQLPHA